MKNQIKTLAAITICLFMVGCASGPMGSNVPFYSDATSMAKQGEEKSTVFLGFIGEPAFPSVPKVAKASGITKIATVEHYKKIGFLTTDYITIVTGE